MDPTQQQQIKQYLSIALRWKKLILSCFLAAIAIGVGVYVITPKLYKAESLLIYQRGKIDPSNKLSPAITARTKEIVDTLQDQVLSRTSLQDIVKKFNLYRNLLRFKPMEDVIDIMRSKDIKIEVSRGETFTVSYQGSNPRKVKMVTNALAAKFVEENLRFRQERATETSDYIKDELTMAKKAIDTKQAAMRDYKLKYYNEMPEQRETNINRLNALQTNYQKIQDSMQDLQRTKVMAQQQISLRKSMLQEALDNNQLPDPMASDANSEEERNYRQAVSELNAARSQLDSLLARYTDKYPGVIRQKKTIQLLEGKVKEAAKALPSPPAGAKGQNNSEQGQPYTDKQLNQLELQLNDINLSMVQLKKEQKETKKQIDTYQKWIAATPIREAEWASLTRDYKQLNDRYQDLVSQNMTAESVESLERQQKGSQFRVVDPAHLPEQPFKPNLLEILLIAVLLGLGVGTSIAFCLEFVDSSFKDAHDLENFLEMPIICSVPLLLTPKEKKKQMISNLFWLASFIIVLAGLIGGIFFLWEKGIIIF